MNQQLIFTNSPAEALNELLCQLKPSKVFLLADENTAQFCLPTFEGIGEQIIIPAGEGNKDLLVMQYVWQALSQGGATRSSLLVNVGGGMVCDLGGFAASTFKRGIRFVNIPTTLLAAVDASVGGKTGINFNGLKNEVGTFTEPSASIISTTFFSTLPAAEMLSGYGEMLKHELLNCNSALSSLLEGDPCKVSLSLVERSVRYKAWVVNQDFKELGLRRALNLGHTAGHAFESLALNSTSPMPHGHAVAHGCIVALVLSHLKFGFPSDVLHAMARFVRENYPAPRITCDDYPTLLALMAHDKKNTDASQVNFTLLGDVGNILIDSFVNNDEIRNALDIYRDLIGI